MREDSEDKVRSVEQHCMAWHGMVGSLGVWAWAVVFLGSITTTMRRAHAEMYIHTR